MDRIAAGTVVSREGRLGVAVVDDHGLCADWETPVVWYGTEPYSGTPTSELEVVGPDPAVADLEACGGGTSRCCAFLAMGAGGFRCIRFTELRGTIMFRVFTGEMVARRIPTEPFPACQSEERYPK